MYHQQEELVLASEAAFILESQKAENQEKMLQIEGEVPRTRVKARVYEGYTGMEANSNSDTEFKTIIYQREDQNGWKYKEIEENILPEYAEDSKSGLKSVLKEKKSRASMVNRYKATKNESVESAHTAERRQSEMVAMMSRLLRQQAALNFDIGVYTSDPVDYHYFIVDFDEVIENKTDDP